ncbi:bifunctional phosphopantothenoylcysteine decarboxylase/phosphopantothenate--cysteine ligase CoaBC [Kingella sp. SNUBH-2017]|uniref:bifunctional phosphopantothenoylcysteine decarboxylase/phosphopantothenate--cysteine ligase CoaBC n=1 Tax=Kingella sp. SNUBH-2017 TaxID=2994077 RepID=UPI0023645B09|nr:bifunctional phosphopantothenoylcysteine decarboxylase/phosphopantothenate--cysteine ligase CoaBC [Kingella sp. SNUBH-2017]MDD2183612.1 bifunctional phosphopantothenoylcysteine decarboxylase/phosphopantothenate--cysteine ligase CoaBC [Kingella sp. SNUBH-2017]
MKHGKHILLGISGSVAAYKACELVRLLSKQGHQVQVVMTASAARFVGVQTLQALSGRPVLTDAALQEGDGMAHIRAVRAADLMLVAPASANTIAKIANGLADNLLTEMAAARSCPLVLAPAMNVEMWNNPANRRNIARLQEFGVQLMGPAEGEQACGETGEGRMLEAAEIAEWLPDLWSAKPLAGKNVLITAGACYEAIDPVRGLTNRSSGRMGVALARACRAAGARVSLVHAGMQVPVPAGLAHVEAVENAQQMYDAVFRRLHGQDVFISVAAVTDYKPAQTAEHKLKKDAGAVPPAIELAENPDILQAVAKRPNSQVFCVGFAAESENLLENARAKREKKGVPLMVANLVSDALGKDSNKIVLLDNEKEAEILESSKEQAARAIVARLATLLMQRPRHAAAAAEKDEGKNQDQADQDTPAETEEMPAQTD